MISLFLYNTNLSPTRDNSMQYIVFDTEAQKGHPLQSTISTISILFFNSLDFHSIFPLFFHSGTS